MGSKIIYQLTVTDIQTVAEQELNRKLKKEEILQLEDTIAENIDWYGAILFAFQEHKLIPKDDDDDGYEETS